MTDGTEEVAAPKEVVDPAAALYEIPELAGLGRVFRSSAPIPLTESKTGYVVSCVKHVYEQNVVLQFNVENTVDNQRIENVTVILESEKGLFEVTGEIPAPAIKCGGTRTCYTVMGRDVGAPMEIYELTSSLHFNVVQVNPVSGEAERNSLEEEYPLEDLFMRSADYMAKITVPNFRKTWEATGNDN